MGDDVLDEFFVVWFGGSCCFVIVVSVVDCYEGDGEKKYGKSFFCEDYDVSFLMF